MGTRAPCCSARRCSHCWSPFAFAVGEGEPVEGGERNPNNNRTQAYQEETEIIGEINASKGRKGGYVTRQSNTSTGANAGGGAIYGCRAQGAGTGAGSEPCLRANNLSSGLAFEFDSNGTLGGTITVGAGGREEKPFTTNATGVATGLNADEVDGLDAQEIAVAGNLFARVNANGTGTGGRGATAAARSSEGVYTVTFEGDVSGCAYQATQTSTENPGTISAQLTASTKNQVTVRTFDESEDPFVDDPATPTVETAPNPDANGNQPADRAFHLTVTC